jgi:hypothetical protein
MTTPGKADLDSTYEHLLTLWTSGVRDYHTMLSDYLTANSIFVAVIGLILSRESLALSFTVLIVLLCIFGILLCLQMAIVLGRLSGQNALWEWRLRGIEHDPEWRKLMTSSPAPRSQPIGIDGTNPRWPAELAFRHRQWWAHRAISFPWFFGSVYALLLVWSVTQLLNP